MSTSEQPTAEQAALQIELGGHHGDDAKLEAALPAMAERVNADSSGTWKAIEWLGIVAQAGCWLGSKTWKGLTFVAERLSSYNERQAKADKTRKEGEAVLVKAKADAALVKAKARSENAKAKEQEIKNETAAELLRLIRERGIDIRAEVRSGQLHVAVVKDALPALPAEAEPEEPTEKSRSRKKQK